MLAWEAYQRGFCKGCGHEKAKAWNEDNEGWYELDEGIVCHACTAREEARREGSSEPFEPVRYHAVIDTRDYEANPLTPILTVT